MGVGDDGDDDLEGIVVGATVNGMENVVVVLQLNSLPRIIRSPYDVTL